MNNNIEVIPKQRCSKRRIVLSWVLVFAWAAFIFYASAHTSQDFSEGKDLISLISNFLKEKAKSLWGPETDIVSVLGHFGEFCLFGILLSNAFACHMPLRKALLCAFLCASAYGATDEFHQLFVPGRFCDPLDWLTDTLGAGLGCVIYRFIERVLVCKL